MLAIRRSVIGVSPTLQCASEVIQPIGGRIMKEYMVLYECGERKWSTYVPDLPGCIATGKTRKQVEQMIREAIEFHIKGMGARGEKIPEPTIEAGTVMVAVK
jgi:predicted RNase H-like HicB family nuclease